MKVLLIIKRKVNGPNGMVRPAPRLLDSDKQEVTTAVGNGSKVRVQFHMPVKVSMVLIKDDLQAVQIVDLVPYKNGDGDEFFADGEEFYDYYY